MTKDLFRQNCQDAFNGADFVPHLHFYIGFQRDEQVYAGAEFDNAALFSPVFRWPGSE